MPLTRDETLSIFGIARSGDVERLENFLQACGASIGIVRSLGSGETLLHEAAGHGHLELARWLLERHPSHLDELNRVATGERQQTPLHYACSGGHLAVARFLLEHGADPRHNSSEWGTPLHRASASGNADLLRLLVEEYRVDVNTRVRGPAERSRGFQGQMPIHVAACHGRTAALAYLLDHGADVKARCDDTHGGRDRSGADDYFKDGESTPVHLAVEYGHVEAAALLLARGADPNASIGNTGEPPMLRATGTTRSRDFWSTPTSAGRRDTANVIALADALLAAGADVNSSTARGWTLLHSAASHGNAKLLEWLLSKGANPNAVYRGTDRRRSVLSVASDANENNAEMRRLLRQAGARSSGRVLGLAIIVAVAALIVWWLRG